MYSYDEVPLISIMYSSYELPDNVLDGSSQAGLLQLSELPLRADTLPVDIMDMAIERIRAKSTPTLIFGLLIIFSFDIDSEFVLTNFQGPFPRRIRFEDIKNI